MPSAVVVVIVVVVVVVVVLDVVVVDLIEVLPPQHLRSVRFRHKTKQHDRC